jgi:hypothetical protein
MSKSAKDEAPLAGRIIHDSRGNAVWNWDKSSDPASTASTSKMLRKLEVEDLRVEDTAQVPAQPGATKGSGYGPGYNPYDRTSPVRVAPQKKPAR